MQIHQNDAGYKWISEAYGVNPVQPFRIRSVIGSAKASVNNNGFVVNTYAASYEPLPTLRDHLTFALKYEGIDLDFLSRLFEKTGPAPIIEWIQREPLGAYARRCAFLYEWLFGVEIEGLDATGGNYVDLLDSRRYLVATNPDNVRRWRVRNNLPGTRAFCPMVALDQLGPIDHGALRDEIDGLVTEYGFDTIERAVNWLTIKESKASFVIESEGKEEDRIRRLAMAMSEHCGRIESAMTDEGMLTIQQAIMGDKEIGKSGGARLGLRHSPVFVGHTSSVGQPVIDYLAPHHKWISGMMEGLRAYEERTRGQNPLLRAAVLSFGFVYIHPLGDGNGRLSRFLINDLLRRDDFLPSPMILPVSAVISENAASRQQYDAALERLSRPLMAVMRSLCEFGANRRHIDGVVSKLHVSDWGRGEPTWRYTDLTQQARYLVGVIEHSIRHGLKGEAQYLRHYDAALEFLKGIIEGRDEDYGKIIHSISQNTGISGKLRKTYPEVFEDHQLAARIERGILEAFELIEPQEDDGEPVPNFAVRPRRG